MAIAFSKYVDITSRVLGSSRVRVRDYILRIFTTNPLVPVGTVVEFSGSSLVSDVGTFFGTTSEEYLRAQFYGGWISKKLKRPQKISFYFWPKASTAPLVYGNPGSYALGTFTAINAGSFTLTLGGSSLVVNVNLAAAGSLAAVAAAVQAAVRTAGAGAGALWTAATVTYDATRKSFQLTGGATGAASISIADGAQSLATALGWTFGALLSPGSAAQSITDVLSASVTASNNFGSFCFTNTAALTLQNVQDAAAWNAAQGVSYIYTQDVTAANAAAWSAALIATPGVGLTTIDRVTYPGEYDELEPSAILAATDYNSADASQNYMYQTFDALTPKVTDTLTSNTYDGLRINYYGATQTAGQEVAFYQRGVLMGGQTAPLDMSTYANEIWLRDAMATATLNLLLEVGRVPINPKGKALITGAHMAVISGKDSGAVYNGVISVGKTLTTNQKATIGEITQDDKAWRQVQTIGYWYSVDFASYTTSDNRTEWRADYLLVYSKDDSVRKVEGTHALI